MIRPAASAFALLGTLALVGSMASAQQPDATAKATDVPAAPVGEAGVVDEAALGVHRSAFTFMTGCLGNVPDLSGSRAFFEGAGYDQPTDDPLIFARKDGGFAGTGPVAMEGMAEPLTSCIVYHKGLERDALSAKFAELAAPLNPEAPITEQGDIYYPLDLGADGVFLVTISEQPQGPYAGNTLLSLVQLSSTSQSASGAPSSEASALQPAGSQAREKQFASFVDTGCRAFISGGGKMDYLEQFAGMMQMEKHQEGVWADMNWGMVILVNNAGSEDPACVASLVQPDAKLAQEEFASRWGAEKQDRAKLGLADVQGEDLGLYLFQTEAGQPALMELIAGEDGTVHATVKRHDPE